MKALLFISLTIAPSLQAMLADKDYNAEPSQERSHRTSLSQDPIERQLSLCEALIMGKGLTRATQHFWFMPIEVIRCPHYQNKKKSYDFLAKEVVSDLEHINDIIRINENPTIKEAAFQTLIQMVNNSNQPLDIIYHYSALNKLLLRADQYKKIMLCKTRIALVQALQQNEMASIEYCIQGLAIDRTIRPINDELAEKVIQELQKSETSTA